MMDEDDVELSLSNGDRVLHNGIHRGRVDCNGDPNESGFVMVKWEGYDVKTVVRKETLTWLPPKRK